MQIRRAECMLLLVTIVAAWGWIFSKYALIYFSTYQFIALRFSLAAIVLVGFSMRSFALLTREQWWRSVVLGVVLGVAILSWVTGLQRTNFIGEGAFLVSLAVVFVPIIGRLFFAEAIPPVLFIALIPAVSGLALLRWEGGGEVAIYQLLFLITAMGLALHINLASHLPHNTPLCLSSAVQLGVTACMALAINISIEPWYLTTSGIGWLWLLCCVLLATSLRYTLQVRVLRELRPSHVGMIMLAEPIWTTLLGIGLLDESMAALQWLGCLLIFSAVLIYRGSFIVRKKTPTS